MTSSTLLNKYRAVRDLVADIQQIATAIDEHLGKFQIYDSAEDLALAIAQAEGLAAQAEQLELKLRRCARPAQHPRRDEARTGEPSPIHAEVSAASVP